MSTVAVLGAGGAMGRGIVHSLAAAGIDVRAWNRTPDRLRDLEGARVTACADPAEAARGAQAVLTILSDADAVLAVMGEGGAAAAAPAGAVWIQAGTIGTAGTDRCLDLARREGLVVVDAPVLGTRQPAWEGELVVLASGPRPAPEPSEEIFEAIGRRTLWAGEAGAGSRLKLAVNTWILSVVEAAAEMLALAAGTGVEPALVLEALDGSPLSPPYLHAKGAAMLAGDFTPSLRLALAAKDARLAVEAAQAAGLGLPMLEALGERLAAAAVEYGDEDMSATFLLATNSTRGQTIL